MTSAPQSPSEPNRGRATTDEARKRGDRLVDAASLKALAHPLRVDIMDRLNLYGPATASQLAEALSESSGATSYHLRQLARHGFIEEDPDKGTARERYWRTPAGSTTFNPAEYAPGSAEEQAGGLVVRQMMDQRARHIDDFVRHGRAVLGDGWVRASMLMSVSLTLTEQELADLNLAISDAVDALTRKYHDRGRVPGAHPVNLTINGIPLVDAPVTGEPS